MRLRFALVVLLFPGIAWAASERDAFYPTTEEVYNDCKTALEAADAKDMKQFYNSRCGASITSIIWTVYNTLAIGPIPFTPSEEDKCAIKTLKSIHEGRFCAISQLEKNGEYPEVQLAKRFIAQVDSKRSNENFEQEFHKRYPAILLTAFTNCKSGSSHD